MTTQEIIAIEDNAGGLHIAVLDGIKCTHWFSGFEHGGADAPSMQEEIAGAAANGVNDWDGNSEDPQEAYDYYLGSQYGYKLIGQWSSGQVEVYEDSMGASGRRWVRA